MPPESASPESASLSVEQAVASLVEAPVEQEQVDAPEAPVEAAEGTEEPQGESITPEDTSEAEEPGDGEEVEPTEGEAEAEPLEAPQRWTTEEKEHFATLDRKSQEILLRQEGKREAVTEKAKAEAAAIRQTADAEMEKVQQLASGLAENLPKWVNVFKDRWGTETPDWVAVAREHGTEQASLLKMRFEQEAQQLQQAAKATADAEALAHQAFVKTEFAKLAELRPELADPAKGPALRKEVVDHLASLGFPEESIRRISAQEMTIARKAMLYDQLQAAAASKPKPKPAAPAPRSTVRPSAAAPQSSSERTATQISNRFAQTRSVDDAVALLLSKG